MTSRINKRKTTVAGGGGGGGGADEAATSSSIGGSSSSTTTIMSPPLISRQQSHAGNSVVEDYQNLVEDGIPLRPTQTRQQQQQQQQQSHHRHGHHHHHGHGRAHQGRELFKKIFTVLAPILVAFIFYNLYASVFKPVPEPPMLATEHLAHKTSLKLQQLWSMLKDHFHALIEVGTYQADQGTSKAVPAAQNVYTVTNKSESTSYHLYQRERIDIYNQPNIHHPHQVDLEHQRTIREFLDNLGNRPPVVPMPLHGGRFHSPLPQNIDFHRLGESIWDEAKDVGHDLIDRIDEQRDHIIAKMYGVEFDYKDRVKLEIEQHLKLFEQTLTKNLESWDNLYKSPVDQMDPSKLHEMRVKSREAIRESRERVYRQNNNHILGPLAAPSA
ncbi:hypothetical protein DFA_07163 [Cavenderia fasciculata]|uniref:Transmembrane protein n=1 Tax=Cavenderia fasciculata TaxID=261658 RepID=F4PVN2_CACFS|nr:uncharacterized protein DFA_07163 [Cavenderia fasciculata]EGG20046.1 hypothetical protein DFA_07163 [Cavenderia fasciculata]|eukprot:XP_004367029.1 hypothetical protein DFA_07163 [Cavenderia fasciculata]